MLCSRDWRGLNFKRGVPGDVCPGIMPSELYDDSDDESESSLAVLVSESMRELANNATPMAESTPTLPLSFETPSIVHDVNMSTVSRDYATRRRRADEEPREEVRGRRRTIFD